jgi:hypothetical protein
MKGAGFSRGFWGCTALGRLKSDASIYTLHSSSRKITFTLSRGWGLAGIETAAKADLFAFSYGMPEGMP